MAEKTRKCSCSIVKSFEFLITLDETPQEKDSDRSQIPPHNCDKCDVVGFEFYYFSSPITTLGCSL